MHALINNLDYPHSRLFETYCLVTPMKLNYEKIKLEKYFKSENFSIYVTRKERG